MARGDKEVLFRYFAEISKALSNPHRLELVDLLTQAPRTVEQLAELAQISIANTSQHLQVLKQARLVNCQREGKYQLYSLADPLVAVLWVDIRRLAQLRLGEIEAVLDRYRTHRHDLAYISMREVWQGMQAEELVLIDARPREEFTAGHLPGAVSLPVDSIPLLVRELPMGKTLVTYCRGSVCVDADDASILLSAYGYPVRRLEASLTEWQLEGYEIEKG
jgi:rhodanese-related sulfurtransferase/DNA-binding transcriptional ArsR family regulator